MADEARPAEPSRHPHADPSERPRSGADAPTEWIGSSQPPPEGPHDGERSSAGGRRRWIAPVAAIAGVVLISGGAFAAYTVLNGGGAQPAEAVPASAIAYVRVDLDPSADQKINMVRLLRNVPEFEEETGITSDTDDLRRRMFELALEDADRCSSLDYDDDIAGWIGERAAVAALPGDGGGGEPEAMLALQVTDEDAARQGLEALIDCGSDSDSDEDPGGVAFSGDYAVLATTQAKAEAYAQAADEESLADTEGFSADMEALDGEGLASFWVDMDAVMELVDDARPETAEDLIALGYDDFGSYSGALRAQSDAMELVVVGQGDLTSITGSSTTPVTDVHQLPDSTLAAIGFTGGADAISSLWDRLDDLSKGEMTDELGPGGIDALADQFEAQFGIALPEDLAVLFGDELTLAIDSEGLALDPVGGLDGSTVNIGSRMRTDADAVRDLLGRVQQLVAATTGQVFDIADADLDDGIVLASNDDYAQALVEGGDLGGTAVFQSAVADSDATSVLFVDLDKLAEVVVREAERAGSPMSADSAETLEVLRAFGVSSAKDGDYTRTTLRLVFD